MSSQPRILVVDDEPQLTRVLRTGLKSRGYDVRAAADGLAGFEAFNDWHPDLVITDLAMANVDGQSFTQRRKGRRKGAKLIPNCSLRLCVFLCAFA